MKTVEKLAIKYLIIGLGVKAFEFLIIIFQSYFLDFIYFEYSTLVHDFISMIISIAPNIIIGSFILFDALKYTKNKLTIPLVAFLIPVIGICFLLFENYIIQKTLYNE